MFSSLFHFAAQTWGTMAGRTYQAIQGVLWLKTWQLQSPSNAAKKCRCTCCIRLGHLPRSGSYSPVHPDFLKPHTGEGARRAEIHMSYDWKIRLMTVMNHQVLLRNLVLFSMLKLGSLKGLWCDETMPGWAKDKLKEADGGPWALPHISTKR